MQRVTITLVGLGALAAMLGLSVWANRPSYRLLYANLEQEDASTIVSRLQEWDIAYEVGAGGRNVFVAGDSVEEVRLRLAGEGVPRGGGPGYELFDKTSFSVTDFVQNINYTRALQGELSRNLARLAYVRSARVMIARPQPTLFVQERKPVTASVVLDLVSGHRLSEGQVAGMANLVAAAVEGLTSDRVTILDTKGNTLAGPVEGKARLRAGTQIEIQREFEDRLSEGAERLLQAMVGEGKATVSVRAEMDFQKTEESSERYEPDSQIPREETVKSVKTQEQPAGGAAGVGAALGGASSSPAAGSSTSQTEDVQTSYEINKTVQTVVKEGAIVRRITVSAIVDESFSERRAEIEGVLSDAVGLQKDRGDSVTVAFAAFPVPPGPEPAPGGLPFGLGPQDLVRGIEGIGALLTVLLLFFLVRPVLRRTLQRVAPAGLTVEASAGQIAAGSGQALLPRGGGESGSAGPMEQLQKVVETDPERVARIMKNWVTKEEV